MKTFQQEADAAAVYLSVNSQGRDKTYTPRPCTGDSAKDELRDFMNRWTQGNLDCVQLDIITDMVAARLKKAEA